MYRRRPILWMLSLFVLFAAHSGEASDAELSDALTVVRTASPTAATTDEVREAWRVLAAADVAELPTILRGMTNSNPAVENWLRAAADAVAARTLAAGGTLPTARLIELLSDTDVSPRARRTAYEWIENIDADQAYQLLATMTNDPSLEIRFDAIAAGLDAADSSSPNGLQKLQTLFRNARNLDQIKDIKARLVELGEVVDLPAHMGFITSWRMVGPFDNANRAGFDVAYPPESSIDFSATFDGKTEPVQWRAEPVTTDNELAEVDIASAFGPVKGAIVYATRSSNRPRQARHKFATLRRTRPNFG